jgi:tRNA 2-thiouridine synthesizing protein D
LAQFCLAGNAMKFAIALFAVPHLPASRRALRFAQAALADGHEIVRLFFYQDGVHSAASNVVSPQDEADLPSEWREFVTANGLDAVVCIAAALRRGVLNAEEAQRYARPAANLQAPWELSGLGQLHEAAQQADRLICFGGH